MSLFKKRKRIIKIFIITIVILLVIYPLSYPVFLPLFEKAYLGEYGYLIYEPLEQIRNNNNTFWYLTESGYKACGGKTSPYKRVFFKNAKRRAMEWNKNGILVYDAIALKGNDSIFGEKILDGKSWYEDGCLRWKLVGDENGSRKKYTSWYKNGIVESEIDFHKNGVVAKSIERSPNGDITSISEFDENGKGTIKFYDSAGKIIAQTYCNKYTCPSDGTFLTPQQKEGNSLVQYLLTYKNGKVIDKKPYMPADNIKAQNIENDSK